MATTSTAAPEHQQRGPVDRRGEDLAALEPVGHRAAGRPACEPDRHQRQDERAGVGQHVRGVGEQRQRVDRDADRDLHAHEADDQRERDRQLLAVRVRGGAVGVRVAGVIVHHAGHGGIQ
jgi:hypothetical protein